MPGNGGPGCLAADNQERYVPRKSARIGCVCHDNVFFLNVCHIASASVMDVWCRRFCKIILKIPARTDGRWRSKILARTDRWMSVII